VADWYYIGHYGQLGPLTGEQMDELIQGGVVARDTYVWHTGMSDWAHAGTVRDLAGSFATGAAFATPPPPPSVVPPSSPTVAPIAEPGTPYGTPASDFSYPHLSPYAQALPAIRSDRSRIVAGVLQLLIPIGIGRIYLGYAAYGVLQFVLVFCFGIGALWSFIDGILILAGIPKLDGYGRVLKD
jgi:hypothetical protein